jgi:cyclic nucleotide gated channel
VGAGDLVDEPKKIAVHYLRGHFLLDFFVVLPLPQVSALSIYICTSGFIYQASTCHS